MSATLALVLLGSVSLGKLPVSLLPDIQLPVLTIRTGYPGAAAEEVSDFVAEKIEEAIAATPGLVDLRPGSRWMARISPKKGFETFAPAHGSN